MFTVNWDKFNIKNADKQGAFERMCRHLFMRKFQISGYDFVANYNQAGLECEPVKVGDKFYGLQCKHSTSHNSTSFYKQLYDSLMKAFNIYKGKLDEIYIFTNLDIKPECTEDELNDIKSKKHRVLIQRKAKELNITLRWIKEENFSEILNEVGNLDLYRLYFSSQNEIAFMDSTISVEERTFLKSTSFMELPINGGGQSKFQEKIFSNKLSILLGHAGTGKTEVMKKMYLLCSEKFLENYSKTSSATIESLPVFIRIRECVNGDLESLIRNRLQDYNIPFGDTDQKFIYFIDGLDEVNVNDVDKTISSIKNLKNHASTTSVIVSSRLNSPNLTFLHKEMDLKMYKIDALDQNTIDQYFTLKGVEAKIVKYETIKSDIQILLNEIEDIFSVNLLWKTIESVNNSTTKIDLISQTSDQLIQNYRKLTTLNLPEIKTLSIEEILQNVSLSLQKNQSLNISIAGFQNIITSSYGDLTYIETDAIVSALSEMFFDVANIDKGQNVYSYKHRRYHEYFLYKKIKQVFYNDPFIFRELGLLPDKDFILNIFLFQELKESIQNRDILKNLSLRFFEAYLGKDYWNRYKNTFIGLRIDYGVGSESYLESEKLLDFLTTKNENDLNSLLNNEGMSIKAFLTQNNYWEFIKRYFINQNKDIRPFLKTQYNLGDDFIKTAVEKNPSAYWYCICAMNSVSFEKIFIKTIAPIKLQNIDSELDYIYSYTRNNAAIISGFFEIGLELFVDQLEIIIPNLTTAHLEVLCYTFLRTENVYYLFGLSEALVKLRTTLAKTIKINQKKQYKLNTIILYNLLTNSNFKKEVMEERFNKMNVYHYGTWEHNIEANSFAAILLGKEGKLNSREYALGVEIRKIMTGFEANKSTILDSIINSIKKYNLIYDNWFSYNNSKLIGELIARFNFEENQVKIFIRQLMNYNSVISLTTVLYTVCLKNKNLFKRITNSKMLTNIINQELKQLSYYDDNTDYNYMLATMVTYFNSATSDKILLIALNNSIYRPAFRKDDLVSYILPRCIYLAHQNDWFDESEIALLISETYSMLKIMKDTTDQGGRWEYFKFILELCGPDSPLLDDIYDVTSRNVFGDTATDTITSVVSVVPFEELDKYYNCEIKGIDYLKNETWRALISAENDVNKELPKLFKALKQSHFPEPHRTNLSEYFHIITSILIDDPDTTDMAYNFILEQGGRSGLMNMIATFSLLGKDELARNYICQLFALTKALVYPSKEYYLVNQDQENEVLRATNLVFQSIKNDWIRHEEKQEMIYLKNPDIKIAWEDTDRDYPFHEEWATNHPDPKAYKVDHSIIFNGVIIEKFSLVYVDGYRALMPVPKMGTNIIKRKKYQISLLFNEEKNLHEYIRRCGLVVE